MKYDSISRRMFLVGGGGMLSIPVLGSLLPRRAEAQLQANTPRRFVMVTSGYSPNTQCYFGQLAANQKAPGNALLPSVGFQALADVPGDISYILSPFTNLKSKISILKHLDVLGLEGAPHPNSFPSCGAGFTGSSTYNNLGMPSVDCAISNSDKMYPQPIAANRRHVACSPNYNGNMNASYNKNPAWTAAMPEMQRCSLVTPIKETEVLWQRFVALFKPASDTPRPGGGSRADVLDPVHADYKRIAADPRLGSQDRARLEAYIALIADIQKDLTAGGTGAPAGKCASGPREPEMPPPPAPKVAGKRAGEGDNTFLARSQDALAQTNEWRLEARELENVRIRNHLRIIAAAMACDLTRVAAFGFGFDGNGDLSHSYDHDGGMYNHKPNVNPYATAFNDQHRRIAGHVAQLTSMFDAIKEGTRTMLDNSIIYWAPQYGTVMRPGDGHSYVCMPTLVAGSGGGKLNSGYFIDYRKGVARANVPVGLPLNNLLVTFMNCFGLPSSDYESRPGEGYGGYNGPFGIAFPDDLKTTEARRMPLPFFYRGSNLG